MSDQNDLFRPSSSLVFPTPRDFQERAHDMLRAGLMEGHQRQMLMAPTGAGKTYIGLRLCNEALKRGRRAVFICDRTTLIDQTSRKAFEYGMQLHGIIQASNPRFNPKLPFQIASAQTIARRSNALGEDFDVIVVDEAHTQYEEVRNLLLTTKAAVIGLSATPFTKGLGEVYSRVVNAATMAQLVDIKELVPFVQKTCMPPDMQGAATVGGEWTQKAAAERGMGLIGDVVLEWKKHADGRKTIVFGSTIPHCEAIAAQFKAVGIEALVCTSKTPDDEAKAMIEEFKERNSRIQVLVSVEKLAKGFDVPDVSCVCDCRPLRKSLSTFVQMIGRGARQSKDTGKSECVLLDFSGNLVRFAKDFSHLYYNGLSELDAGERLDREIRKDPEEKTGKACPACGASPMGGRCVTCGFEPKTTSLVAHEHGSAVDIDVLKRVTKFAESKWDLYCMLATSERARVASRGSGDASKSTYAKYCEIANEPPPRSFRFADVTPMEASPALERELKHQRIAWAKRMEREARERKQAKMIEPKPETTPEMRSDFFAKMRARLENQKKGDS